VNLINVALVATAAIIILSQGWINLFKAWVQGKIGETQTGQTKT
jgi:hypothetical protein